MSGGVYERNPDGSLTPATPLGWQGSGIDWEVYNNARPKRAEAYDEDVLVAVVRSRWCVLLALKMRYASRKLRRSA